MCFVNRGKFVFNNKSNNFVDCFVSFIFIYYLLRKRRHFTKNTVKRAFAIQAGYLHLLFKFFFKFSQRLGRSIVVVSYFTYFRHFICLSFFTKKKYNLKMANKNQKINFDEFKDIVDEAISDIKVDNKDADNATNEETKTGVYEEWLKAAAFKLYLNIVEDQLSRSIPICYQDSSIWTVNKHAIKLLPDVCNRNSAQEKKVEDVQEEDRDEISKLFELD